MKIIVDNDLTLGKDLRFVRIDKWTDYNDKNKVLGSKIQVLLYEKGFDKVTVKVNKNVEDLEMYNDFLQGYRVNFNNLVGSVYSMNNQAKVSFVAEDVQCIREQG